MYNFYYKPRFYFLNPYILNIFLGSYHSIVYWPVVVPGSILRPTSPLYYDLRFYEYIVSLIRGRASFLGLKPFTFSYFFFVGLFLRILWFFGAGYRFYPAHSRFDEIRLFGFYDIEFSPLAQLSKLWYYWYITFFGFSATHYEFNPNFWFYHTPILGVARDNFFLSNVFFLFRFAWSFKFLAWHSLVFFCSIPFHFILRPIIWITISNFGRFWFAFISTRTSPVLSFEFLWSVYCPVDVRLSRGFLTGFFFRAIRAYRLFKSTRFLAFFGLLRPKSYFGRSTFHYKYAYGQTSNELFETFKFHFVQDIDPTEEPFKLKILRFINKSRLESLYHLRTVARGALPLSDQLEIYLDFLSVRSLFLISRRSAIFSIFLFAFFSFVGRLVRGVLRFAILPFFFIFGPASLLWSVNVLSLKSFLTFNSLGSTGFFSRLFQILHVQLILILYPFVTVFSDIFLPFFSRLYVYAQLQTQHTYFTRLKKLFQKLHYNTVYSRYFHEHDQQALSSHLDTLDAPDIDPDDFYDTDLAEGDDYDAAFVSSDSATAIPHPFDIPNSGSYDQIIPTNFFSAAPDAYDREANITQVFLFHSLLPNFYEFYRRQQYKHISEEFWHQNHEWHEDPGYEGEETPVDYETFAPTDKGASQLINWANSYKQTLNNWQQHRSQRLPPDFLRGTGSPFSLYLPAKFSQRDWTELTLFVAKLSANTSSQRYKYYGGDRITQLSTNQIWQNFANLCRTAPDTVFKRVLAVDKLPSVFENAFIYPSSSKAGSFVWLAKFSKLLFGERFREHPIYGFIIALLASFGIRQEDYCGIVLLPALQELRILSDYFDSSLHVDSGVNFRFSSTRTQIHVLLLSNYFRRLALENFADFLQRSSELKDPSLLEILRVHARYVFTPPTPKSFKPDVRSLGFLTSVLAFLREPNLETFSDYIYRFWVHSPQETLLRSLTGDGLVSERVKIDSAHPRDSLISYFFIPAYFNSLFGERDNNFLFSNSWFSKNKLPPQVGPLPRADDYSVFWPERRTLPHEINPFPNDIEGWLGLTPFFSFVQDTFTDPHVINLTLPAQFDWLGLEDTYRWDVETDLDQLDMYDEYLDYTSEFWLDDDEDLPPTSPYEGQLNEDDIDSLSIDPDSSELGYDLMGEAATLEDLYLTDEEPWDNEYAEETHLAYYTVDHEEFSVENYGDDEWGTEDFNLFLDASIPLARLFFGGLRIGSAFPATDTRIFLGTFADNPADTSLHFTTNFNRAKKNVETVSLAVTRASPFSFRADVRPTSLHLFLKSPVISVFLKAVVYSYVFFKDALYTYIFFDFQARRDVQRVKLRFHALNHYFKWSSFYGNKYYFKKFSSSLVEWLDDFEHYRSRSTREVRLKDFYLFGYFRISRRTSHLQPFARFLPSLPLFPFWHATDSSLFNEEDDTSYLSVTFSPNYGHADKWSLYERQRFTKLIDLPTYPASVDPYVDEAEGSFLDLMPDPNDEDFINFDDALLFSYATEGDFLSHLDEFTSRIAIMGAACLDLFDIVRDYTLYGARLFFNFYVIGVFRYWVTFSDAFWLRLAVRLGFWINFLRYFLLVSVYLALLVYALFVLPRFSYYLFGSFFSTSVILIINGFLAAILILGLALLAFNPFFHFFRVLTKFEREGLLYLIFFIFFQHVFYGYLRVGTPNVARLDMMDSHVDTQRLRRELNYDTAHERSHIHTQRGFVAHRNLETVGELVPLNLERFPYGARTRQNMFWRGREAYQEWPKRSVHFEISYSRAPFSLSTFFYLIKSNVLQIRSRAFTGHRYVRYYRKRLMDIVAQNDIHEVLHRFEQLNVGSVHPRVQAYWVNETFQRCVDGYQTKHLAGLNTVTGAGHRFSRTTRKNYFSPRHRGYVKRTWTPFAYDFRPKTLDHAPGTYSTAVNFTKKFDFSYNRFGRSARQRNDLLRLPIWHELLLEDQDQSRDPRDLFHVRERYAKRDRALKEVYQSNHDVDEVFNPPLDSSFFTSRPKQPKAFYNKNFNVYAYGDWRHRRALLMQAYAFKQLRDPAHTLELAQYYHFIRKRSRDAHFSNLYSKNLRDFILKDRPAQSYTLGNIYNQGSELDQLAKLFGTNLLSYKENPYSLYAFSRYSPYPHGAEGRLSRMRPNSRFLSKDRHTAYDDLQKYYEKKSASQTNVYHSIHFNLLNAHSKIFGNRSHNPTKLVLSKVERAQFLAVSRYLRAIRQRNKVMHMTKNFSNFHFFKSLIPSSQYPRDALALYLSFENSRVPKFSRETTTSVQDPYYQRLNSLANSERMDAFLAKPTSAGLNSSIAANLLPLYHKGSNKRPYDPIDIYDFSPEYDFYTLPDGGLTNTGLKFSFIFDDPEVYDDEHAEFAEFNRSANLQNFPMRAVADYEDYLDDFLQRRPDPDVSFTITPGREATLFGQFPLRKKFYHSLDLYEQVPQLYDPFKIRKYKEVRSARRFMTRQQRFMIGERRKHRPGRLRRTKGRAKRFSQFANHLAAVSEYNQAQSLGSVYFSEFKKLVESSHDDLTEAQYARVSPNRQRVLAKFFNDDEYYHGRWAQPAKSPTAPMESAEAMTQISSVEALEDFVSEMDTQLTRRKAVSTAAAKDKIKGSFHPKGRKPLARISAEERAQTGEEAVPVVDLVGNEDNVVALRERKRHQARLARESLSKTTSAKE